MVKRKRRGKASLKFFGLSLILTGLGLFFVFDASSVKGFLTYKDSFYFLKLQAVWFAISLVVFFLTSRLDYHKWYYLAFYLAFFSLLSLIVVLIPGIGKKVGGARRWIDLGLFNFQPSEFAKFSLVVYLSSWFLYKERKRFFSFLLLLGAIVFLIILQPDMGSAVILFALSVGIYFVAGLEFVYLLGLFVLSFFGGVVAIILVPYRLRRLLAFLNPDLDPTGITYHLNQIRIAFSNGGLFGKGLGFSQQKYLFLPEAHTDSIFAIVAEEVGFMGVLIILLLYWWFLYKIYQIVLHSKDKYGLLLSSGVLLYFGLHFIINLSGLLNLMPMTGVPLPLFSYGGSNLLVSYALLGILYNIEKRSL